MIKQWTSLLLGCLTFGLAVAASRDSLVVQPQSRQLRVAGLAETSGWLGMSAYSKKSQKIYLHQVRYVHRGNLSETFSLGPDYSQGTYEMALWQTRVPERDCKTKCSWCKANGYHMEGLRAYTSGDLTP